MEEKNTLGIEETKEVLIAANEIGLVVVKHVKDGVQATDIPAIVVELFNSDDFKQAIAKAVENVTLVPKEIADISLAEGLELAKEQIAYVPKLLAALKK
jgi:hypothetical protein